MARLAAHPIGRAIAKRRRPEHSLIGRRTLSSQTSNSLATFASLTILNWYKLRIDNDNDREVPRANGFRFAIVASRWNDALVSRLINGAVEALHESGANDEAIEIFRVPGSFELSLCALKAAQSAKFDAVICLGVVIKGETPHFDFVAAEAARGINEAGMQTGVPVMFGVITANTVAQAEARAGTKHDNKGFEAALAAVEVVNLYRDKFKG